MQNHHLILTAILFLTINSVASESENMSRLTSTPLAVIGLRRTFATAYQSCDSLKLKTVDSHVQDLEGVEEKGLYPGSWTGHFTQITDQTALANSHYYVKDFKPSSACVNVKKYTMIYDFGGKPVVTSAGTLNFWKNSGGGSPGYGVDCSGFVFTALANAGLRLRAGKQLKAAEVENYPASMYVDAPASGFSCLLKPKMGKSGSLQAGDVIASKYHVAIIERVGEDPLAITKYSDCNQITYRDFDFVIAQSSPEFNYIGINKVQAKDYLGALTKFIFRGGLENTARQACQAYQAGQDVVVGSSSFGISRHKLTPNCLQNEIKLEGESCVASCQELYEPANP